MNWTPLVIVLALGLVFWCLSLEARAERLRRWIDGLAYIMSCEPGDTSAEKALRIILDELRGRSIR